MTGERRLRRDAIEINRARHYRLATGAGPWRQQLALLPAIKKVMDEVMSGPSGEELGGTLAAEQKLVSNAKKLAMLIAGAASQKYMQKLADQQEVMGAIADMVIEACAMDSALLRARKYVSAQGEEKAGLVIAMTQVYLEGAFNKLEAAAKKIVLAAVAEGDMLRTQMAIVRRLAKHEPVNIIALQEKIASRVLETGKYVTA